MRRTHPDREKRLLNEWRKGTPIRQAAINTRMPEGTVTRFYALFNRNPEEHGGQAIQTQVEEMRHEEKSVNHQLYQLIKFKGIQSVTRTYRALINNQQYLEAKTFLEAERTMAEFIESNVEQMRGISAYTWYCSDPERYAFLIPNVVDELSRQIRDLDSSPHDWRSILESMDDGERSPGERKAWQKLRDEFEKVMPKSKNKTRFDKAIKEMKKQAQERVEKGAGSELDKILVSEGAKKRQNVGNRK